MSALFSFVHLSDFHFCIEPVRRNLLSLSLRKPRTLIDTCLQPTRLGFRSLARPASYSPTITSSVAQFCYAYNGIIDSILISGDLATTGQQSDILVAKDFVTAPSLLTGFVSSDRKPTLSASRLPVWVMPGNHDRYIDNKGSPTSRNFELTFKDLMPNHGSRVWHKVYRKSGKYLGIIFADFCLHQRSDATNRILAPFGQGKVYDIVLHELEDRTRSLRRKFSPIQFIWVIHFAPFDCGSLLQLIDWRVFVRSAQAHNVLATLCGHTHQSIAMKVGNHVIYCAGSAGAIDQEDDSCLHIIDVDLTQSAIVSRKNYRWDRKQGEFIHYNND